MNREFHISAFDSESRYAVKGAEDKASEVFTSLFEAARYARTQLDHEEGWVVVYNGTEINRIPVHAN